MRERRPSVNDAAASEDENSDRPHLSQLVRDPKWRGLSVILIGTFLSVIVHNIATVTLPSIAADFGSTLAEVQWVAIAVSLTTAAVVMPAGYLADRLGRRAFFIGGMALFAGASLMAGWAPSLELLIAARLLQGAATAIVGANGIAIAVTIFSLSLIGESIADLVEPTRRKSR